MKFKLKSILGLVMVSFMTLNTVACSTKGDKEEPKAHTDKKRIGIVQIVEHPSLNMIRETFIKHLAEKGFKDGENIVIDYENAQGDQSNLKTICQKLVNNKMDLIVAIATPSAQAVVSETKDIPILFSACTDPIAAGLVDNFDKPGKNVTGTSDAVSAEQIMKLADRITQGINKLGVVYSTNETSSACVVRDLKKYAEGKNIKIMEATVTSSSEVNQSVQSLIDKVDAFFIPIDNIIATAMPLVSQLTIKAKKPVYVGADSLVKDGGLASCGINYTILGNDTADMAVEILNGKKAGDIPVKVMKDLNIYINKDTARDIGIKIPEDIMKEATEIFENK